MNKIILITLSTWCLGVAFAHAIDDLNQEFMDGADRSPTEIAMPIAEEMNRLSELAEHDHPMVHFDPGPEYGPEARNYQGIPAMERAPGGRLWAAWYAGPVWEDRFNFVVVSTSGDDGETWTDRSFVIDADGTGPKRTSDPGLWLDPNGKLWLFFLFKDENGLEATMAMTTDQPDEPTPAWTQPVPIFLGHMINKPTVTSQGEWLASTCVVSRDYSTRVMVSRDEGKTWNLRGAVNIPKNRRNADESMIVEREDHSFWMLVRTGGYGIGESLSTDNGKTWTEVADYQQHATTRFHFRKLQSGHLLLIRNGPLDERGPRNRMTAYLSMNDGKTWKGGLLLDERTSSYPDATQAPDGRIYAIYDHERNTAKEILMAVFDEEDVLAGDFISASARQKVLINKATGVNPLTSPRMGEGPGPQKDLAAAKLTRGKPRAELIPVNGTIEPVIPQATLIFSDADWAGRLGRPIKHLVPSVREYVHSSFKRTEVRCTKAGMVYVLTPAPDRNPNSVEAELVAQGFVKTSAEEIDVILKLGERFRAENLCSVYQKEVEAGETIQFGEWGVLVF